MVDGTQRTLHVLFSSRTAMTFDFHDVCSSKVLSSVNMAISWGDCFGPRTQGQVDVGAIVRRRGDTHITGSSYCEIYYLRFGVHRESIRTRELFAKQSTNYTTAINCSLMGSWALCMSHTCMHVHSSSYVCVDVVRLYANAICLLFSKNHKETIRIVR